MINRLLTGRIKKDVKSVLLLGPRQVGKSTLLESLGADLFINLADQATYLEHASHPDLLRELVHGQRPSTVLIDEVQRLPSLLNTVQALVDSKEFRGRLRFFLSGSSARKLRRGQANLLPGRILAYSMGPLCAAELDYRLDTEKALCLGTLPEPYLNHHRADAEKLLRTYAAVYLREEIQAEALTRNLEGFSRFLLAAALASGKIVDFTKTAREAKLSRMACKRFFEVLEDTLVANRCESMDEIPGADVVKHPKFYFFDTGVLNGLLGNFTASADRMGSLFEHLVFNQILNSAKARDRDVRIRYFRTRSGVEVDFIVEMDDKLWAIEAKTGTVTAEDLTSLERFGEACPKRCQLIAVTPKTASRKIGNVAILSLPEMLKTMEL